MNQSYINRRPLLHLSESFSRVSIKFLSVTYSIGIQLLEIQAPLVLAMSLEKMNCRAVKLRNLMLTREKLSERCQRGLQP